MKLTALLFLTCCLHVAAIGVSQTVTFSGKDVPLEKVFSEVKKQTGFVFFFDADLLKDIKPVSIKAENLELEAFLSSLFKDQPLKFSILDKAIVVSRKPVTAPVSNSNNASDLYPPGPIKIRVTDADGRPLSGATITSKKSKKMGVTDAEGVSTLVLDENDIVIVSYVGYESQSVLIKNNTTSLIISLKQEVKDLDESIVVAYNTISQKRNTGAVTVVRGEQIATLPNRSFDKSLQGLVPGLLVTSGTGQPGGGVSNFVLRGIATAANVSNGSTVRNPLIVIDGIPISQENIQIATNTFATPLSNPLSQLNPYDIESISVLKDAAAVALYGSRASNGVILITTKKGKLGKTVFNFHHQTDISSRLKGKIEFLSQEEYLELLFESYRNSNPGLYANDAVILTDLRKKFPVIVNAPGDTSFYATPNFYNELFHDRATTLSNELSISGGNEKSNFYLNFEYTKQNGIVKKTGYDRKSVRFNFENHPVSWLTFGFNTLLSYNVQSYSGSSALNGAAANIGVATFISPLNPVRMTDGSYVLNYPYGAVGSRQTNPVAEVDYNKNSNTSYRGLSKISGKINFLKYFKFSSNLGVDYMFNEAREKADPRLYDDGNGGALGGRVEELDIRRSNLISTNILQFDGTFGTKHTLGVVAGQEAQILDQKNLNVAVRGLAFPYYDQISSPGVSVLRQGGLRTKETLLSFFGQANYSFNNKYFLTGSLRRDGSSRFGDDRRFGTYWSTGAAWLISAEPFMQQIEGCVDYLKIRGSIGAAGNAGAINATTRYDALGNLTYLNNTAVFTGGTPGNPDVQWEQTFTWDAGIEGRFFKDRIALTADIYNRATSDLIYNIVLPQNSGYSEVLANIGNMRNSGIELSFSADVIRYNNFRWNINANWSSNRNKLTKANTSLESLQNNYVGNKEGENFNSFYLVQWAGVNSSDGKPLWVDSLGNPSSNYSAAKRVFVGKPQPDGFGSIINTINYKQFELSVMFSYQYGFEVYNNSFAVPLLSDGRYPYANQIKQALDRWQKPGDLAQNPRRILNNTDGGERFSTRFLHDGDFIRLQNLTLTYSFPRGVASQLKLSAMKLFVQAYNLAIWTRYPGIDPADIGVFGDAHFPYPNQRTFSIGINVAF